MTLQSQHSASPPDGLFDHVATWVFDLDNTLYHPSSRLFDQIEKRMTAFVMNILKVEQAEADRLRRHYWSTYGTTLAGLMQEHGMEPDAFLVDVHDISFEALLPDPQLSARITRLPGRKIVYTNGSSAYALRVLEARGLARVFDAVYGIEHARYRPKPEQQAFETVFALDGLNPAAAAMFEDDARNLEVPAKLGMRTIHVAPERGAGAHIHHHTDDLGGFLAGLIGLARDDRDDLPR